MHLAKGWLFDTIMLFMSFVNTAHFKWRDLPQRHFEKSELVRILVNCIYNLCKLHFD